MSFQEVKKLRQEGKLNEALTIATNDFDSDKENIWNKRSLGWVYYAKLKQAEESNNLKEFLVQLKNINQLELPKEEAMIFNSCAWQIGKILFNNQELNPDYITNIFESIKQFEFTKPDDAYSFLLKGFKKHAHYWREFISFTEWWGMNNFQEEDYTNFVTDKGRSLPSLVESVYIAIAKYLLEIKDLEKIKTFIPLISKISDAYENMQYPPFYYAKLLLAIGDKEHFFDAFLPFAKKKQSSFWVWSLMSEVFDKNSEEYFSCLCRAASCNAPDKFTGDVREKLGNYFLSKNMFPEAKYEYLKLIESRNKEGWPLKDKHLSWQLFSWWNSTEATRSNKSIYEKNNAIAESLLFSNIPQELIIVERVNKEKSIINFIATKIKYGFTSYKNFKINPQVGDTFAVRFVEKKNKNPNFYKCYTLVKSDQKPPVEIYKEITGTLKIINGNTFGFINNIYIPPQIIRKYDLKNNAKLNAIALQSYNTKKEKWDWRVIKIKK